MLGQIIELFRRRKDYLLLSSAFLLSGIGTAFTLIVVYAEFERLKVSAHFYALAFICGLLPGLIASGLGPRWAKRFSIAGMIIFGECIGALALILPAFTSGDHLAYLLLGVEVVGSFVAGLLFPLVEIYTRATFKDDELPLVSIVSSYVFSAQFVLGQFLGTLIYPWLGKKAFLGFDFFTYAVSALLVAWAWKRNPGNFVYQEGGGDVPNESFLGIWRGLNADEKRAFSVSPILAAVCAPSMSLLPLATEKTGSFSFSFASALSPVLVLLLAKTIGQMLGPTVFRSIEGSSSRFDSLLRHPFVLPALLGAYLAFYAIVFRTSSFLVAIFATVSAHIFSNIVFVVATYALNRHFSVEKIGKIAGWHYRITVGLMALSSLWASSLHQRFGYGAVNGVSWGILIVLPLLLSRSEKSLGQEVPS